MDLASPAVSGTSVYANGLMFDGSFYIFVLSCLRDRRYLRLYGPES